MAPWGRKPPVTCVLGAFGCLVKKVLRAMTEALRSGEAAGSPWDFLMGNIRTSAAVQSHLLEELARCPQSVHGSGGFPLSTLL